MMLRNERDPFASQGLALSTIKEQIPSRGQEQRHPAYSQYSSTQYSQGSQRFAGAKPMSQNNRSGN